MRVFADGLDRFDHDCTGGRIDDLAVLVQRDCNCESIPPQDGLLLSSQIHPVGIGHQRATLGSGKDHRSMQTQERVQRFLRGVFEGRLQAFRDSAARGRSRIVEPDAATEHDSPDDPFWFTVDRSTVCLKVARYSKPQVSWDIRSYTLYRGAEE